MTKMSQGQNVAKTLTLHNFFGARIVSEILAAAFYAVRILTLRRGSCVEEAGYGLHLVLTLSSGSCRCVAIKFDVVVALATAADFSAQICVIVSLECVSGFVLEHALLVAVVTRIHTHVHTKL